MISLTVPILLHKMRILTRNVFSVMPEATKFDQTKKKLKIKFKSDYESYGEDTM